MQQQTQAAEPQNSARCPDSGLSQSEQQQRQQAAIQWVRRMLTLMETTGCSAKHAFQAVEAADTVQP